MLYCAVLLYCSATGAGRCACDVLPLYSALQRDIATARSAAAAHTEPPRCERPMSVPPTKQHHVGRCKQLTRVCAQGASHAAMFGSCLSKASDSERQWKNVLKKCRPAGDLVPIDVDKAHTSRLARTGTPRRVSLPWSVEQVSSFELNRRVQASAP